MKHRQRLIGITLASALVLSLATTALATGGTTSANNIIPGGGGGLKPSDEEIAANGNTTISIMQAKVDPHNVSFTVPLYVTLAVVEGEPDVKVPDNYGITNTSTAAEGTVDDNYNIGVTAMSFERLGDYKTVKAENVGNDPKNIYLNIGGMDMPALDSTSASQIAPVPMTGGVLGTPTAPTPITVGEFKKLEINGTVSTTHTPPRDEAAAAAQFKVRYTISLLDSHDKPMGWVYAGDDRTQAGLEPFPTPTPAP